jgi:hypothetical protein
LNCNKCGIKIVRQFWLVENTVLCSPKCERGEWVREGRMYEAKFKYRTNHRHSDKVVEKVGLAGLKKTKKW